MNVKAGAIVGGGAFVLSFFAGLFARNAFVTVFIRALVFAFIFCGLYFLISFLFSKFLSEMSSQDLADKDEQPKVPLTGGKVDLVIQDENLENEETGPKFVLKDGKSFDEEEIPVNKEAAIAPDAQKILLRMVSFNQNQKHRKAVLSQWIFLMLKKYRQLLLPKKKKQFHRMMLILSPI